MAVAGTRNWTVTKDPKYAFDDIGFRRKTNKSAINIKPMVVTPKSPEGERNPGRGLWKDIGKNQEIRRMFVSGALSMFAEIMRPSLEKVLDEVLETFSDVIIKSIPYWDMLSEEDKDGWAERARVEKKTDHYIYMRKVPIRDKPTKTREIVTTEFEECESDPDEMPGEMIPHDETDLVTVESAVPVRVEVKSASPSVMARHKPIYGHRADALQHWVPANRQVRFLDEKKSPRMENVGNGHGYTQKYKPHHNFKHYKENYHFRDTGVMEHY